MGPTDAAGAAPWRTPDEPPWNKRRRAASSDPRDAFSRDRDRIIHSDAFHALQHKMQVFLIYEGDFYRTRLTHSLEVAQIGRTIARLLGLNEPLVEAIALAHDLGHTPFGHAGESVLDEALRGAGDMRGWDSNQHSLFVVDELEVMYPGGPGLNLTLATRQGIARHATPFDNPNSDFDSHAQPTPECQVVNLADTIAYAGHDIQDALEVGLLSPDTLRSEAQLDPWPDCWRRAEAEVRDGWGGHASDGSKRDEIRLIARRARRHFIDHVIHEAVNATRQTVDRGMSFDQVIERSDPVVVLPEPAATQLQRMVGFLFETVYSSLLIARQNEKERFILRSLFDRLHANPRLMSPRYCARWERASDADKPREIAYFLASLTDRGALDLYAELFDPHGRAMGHRLA